MALAAAASGTLQACASAMVKNPHIFLSKFAFACSYCWPSWSLRLASFNWQAGRAQLQRAGCHTEGGSTRAHRRLPTLASLGWGHHGWDRRNRLLLPVYSRKPGAHHGCASSAIPRGKSRPSVPASGAGYGSGDEKLGLSQYVFRDLARLPGAAVTKRTPVRGVTRPQLRASSTRKPKARHRGAEEPGPPARLAPARVPDCGVRHCAARPGMCSWAKARRSGILTGRT